MKSYWVSTSQKMTRGIARNLFGDGGTCQRQGLQPQHYCHLVATILPGTACAIRPHLERELLALSGHEPELQEEGGLARQCQHLVQPLRAALGGERLEQPPAPPRALPPRMHGETGDLGESARIDLERAAAYDLAVRSRGDGVFLDVPTQVIVTARQQVARRDVGGHERLEGRHVGEHRAPHGNAVDRYREGDHASTASRIPTPRSSSSCVMTSGGMSRTTLGPAVATSRRRSRAAATTGAAGSVSSTPHSKPRPRPSATRPPRSASRARRAP